MFARLRVPWHLGYFNGSEVSISSTVQVYKSKSDMTLSLTRGRVWKLWTKDKYISSIAIAGVRALETPWRFSWSSGG